MSNGAEWPRLRWYLEVTGEAIGPFASMTKAFRHRRMYGPDDALLVQRADGFYGVLFLPVTPEGHRSREWLSNS